MSGKDIRETVGLLAVVSGLAFVGLEVRQNNVLAEAAAYQEIGVATAAAWDTQAHDLQFLANISQPPEAMNRSAWHQWAVKMTVFARLGETALLQVERGVLPEDAMERLGYAGWLRLFENPQDACVWPFIRQGVSASFRRFVEEGRDIDAIDCSEYDIPDWRID